MGSFIESFNNIFLWVCSGLFILYLPRIYYWVYAFKKQRHLVNSKKNRFALIIPARYDSAVVPSLLDSIAKQTYDKNFFDTFVIVSDFVDPTVEIVKNYQNTNLHVETEQTCKGEALDSCLKKILSANPDYYDAYIIIDADNILKANFVEEMNNALMSGKQIIVSKKLIKNRLSKSLKANTFFSTCSGLSYTYVDDFGNAYRTKHGIACSLCGTGMTVTKDVIKELNGWPYRTMTEDFELTADSILRGYTTMYYRYAQNYTEEATTFKVTCNRLMRWLNGYQQTNKLYRSKIEKDTWGSGKIKVKNFDFLYGLWPFLAYLIAGILNALTNAVFLVIMLSKGGNWQIAFNGLLLTLLILYVPMVLYTAIVLIADGKNLKLSFIETFIITILNPFFFILYAVAYVRGLFVDVSQWQQVERVDFEGTLNEV